MAKTNNDMLTLCLLGGGKIITIVCYNKNTEFKRLDSFYRSFLLKKKGVHL